MDPFMTPVAVRRPSHKGVWERELNRPYREVFRRVVRLKSVLKVPFQTTVSKLPPTVGAWSNERVVNSCASK